MSQITFNEWQSHIANELQKNYKKLNLIKNENIPAVSRGQSADIRGVQKVRIPANK